MRADLGFAITAVRLLLQTNASMLYGLCLQLQRTNNSDTTTHRASRAAVASLSNLLCAHQRPSPPLQRVSGVSGCARSDISMVYQGCDRPAVSSSQLHFVHVSSRWRSEHNYVAVVTHLH